MTEATDQSSGGDRVNIENEVHDTYKDIVEKSGKSIEYAPFLLQKDVFMWAVAIGFKQGQKRPLAPGRQQPFRWSQLSQDLDVPALKAIAVADTGSVEVLLNKERILRIAEEYANFGIRLVKSELIEQPGRLLWRLTALSSSNSPDGL